MMFDDLKDKVLKLSLKLKKQIEELKRKVQKKESSDEDSTESIDLNERTIVEDIGHVEEKTFNTEISADNDPDVPKEDDDDYDDEDDDDDEEAKKKKISQIIRAFVVLVILYFVVDELFLKKEQEITQNNTSVKRRKKRQARKKNINAKPKRVKKKSIVKEKKLPEKVKKETKVSVQDREAKKDQKVEEITPIEVKPTEHKDEVKNKQKEKTVEIAKKDIGIVTTKDKKESKMKASVKAPIEATSKGEKQENLLQSEKLIKQVETKILERKEYVKPPNYERVGRGLVYSCSGGHWACVDKKSYFSCLGNEEWATYGKKVPECKTAEVYASHEDCRVIQFYNINTNKSTEFCNKLDE